MAHYAFLDENNIVTQVIVGRDEDEFVEDITDWEEHYGQVWGAVCKRTSYNTVGNWHINNKPAFRGNFAAPGYYYNEELDVFIPPKPYESWVLDHSTFLWKAPVEKPESPDAYLWDEQSVSWVLEQ